MHSSLLKILCGGLALAFLVFAVVTGVRCPVRREAKIVSGTSLVGLVPDGARITILNGYYSCKSVQRGDVVAYRLSSFNSPVIKIVQAVPGDTWALARGGNRYHIQVNGETLLAPGGTAYSVDSSAAQLLSLYIRDFHGVIPKESYLVLGSAPSGTFDSSQTGLVSANDIIGKVEY